MEDYRREMIALAEDIAAEFGMTVADEPDRVRGAAITDASGRGYNLTEYRIGDTKLTVKPVYPASSYSVYDDDGNRIEPGEIGVSKSRGARAIAADIRRRLEPHYDYRLAKIIKINERVAQSEADRLFQVARLTSATGLKITAPAHLQSEGRSQLSVSTEGSGYGDLILGGAGESVTFDKFSVPADAAIAMLQAYENYKIKKEN